jgi:hypothetical protein
MPFIKASMRAFGSVDCGFLSRFPEITDAPVADHGLRLLRIGTKIQ